MKCKGNFLKCFKVLTAALRYPDIHQACPQNFRNINSQLARRNIFKVLLPSMVSPRSALPQCEQICDI